MNQNYIASVAFAALALSLMALRFHMDGDDFGVALVAITAAIAWASCYLAAMYEQNNYEPRGLAIVSFALTAWAVVFAIAALIRMVFGW